MGIGGSSAEAMTPTAIALIRLPLMMMMTTTTPTGCCSSSRIPPSISVVKQDLAYGPSIASLSTTIRRRRCTLTPTTIIPIQDPSVKDLRRATAILMMNRTSAAVGGC